MYWILSKGISVKIGVTPNIANIRLNIDTKYQASLARFNECLKSKFTEPLFTRLFLSKFNIYFNIN